MIDVRLDGMLLVAIVRDFLPDIARGEFRRSAVLVGAADDENVVADLAVESRVVTLRVLR
jgi:hypothetical protein